MAATHYHGPDAPAAARYSRRFLESCQRFVKSESAMRAARIVARALVSTKNRNLGHALPVVHVT